VNMLDITTVFFLKQWAKAVGSLRTFVDGMNKFFSHGELSQNISSQVASSRDQIPDLMTTMLEPQPELNFQTR
jgi:hypothetical protein